MKGGINCTAIPKLQIRGLENCMSSNVKTQAIFDNHVIAWPTNNALAQRPEQTCTAIETIRSIIDHIDNPKMIIKIINGEFDSN